MSAKNIVKSLGRACGAAVVLLSIGITPAEAGAISANFSGIGFSFAGAVVPGDADFDMQGALAGPTQATAVARAGGNFATSQAFTSPPFGIHVDAGIVFGTGLADIFDPFVDPIHPIVGLSGQAQLAFTGSQANPFMFNVTGLGSHNANGYLELAVLSIGNTSFDNLTMALIIAGSVEKAVASGLIPHSLVLATFREGALDGSFNFDVPLGNISSDNVVVVGVAHAVGVIPEPSTLLLLALACMISLSCFGRSARLVYLARA